jgi:hypothetical protein
VNLLAKRLYVGNDVLDFRPAQREIGHRAMRPGQERRHLINGHPNRRESRRSLLDGAGGRNSTDDVAVYAPLARQLGSLRGTGGSSKRES